MNRILIIDDDKELCALIRQSVLQESIEADCCYLGRDGLAKLEENNYQLVILDIMMPELDGIVGAGGKFGQGEEGRGVSCLSP